MYDYEFFPQNFEVWPTCKGTHLRQTYGCLGHRYRHLPQPHTKWLYVRTKFSQSSVFYSNLISSFHECDAAIVTTSYAYDSISLDALKQYSSDMQKELHVLGPLLPSNYGAKLQNGEEGTSSDIETFLREMLVEHGERSVFFVISLLFFCIRTYSNILFLRFPLALYSGHLFWNTLTN